MGRSVYILYIYNFCAFFVVVLSSVRCERLVECEAFTSGGILTSDPGNSETRWRGGASVGWGLFFLTQEVLAGNNVYSCYGNVPISRDGEEGKGGGGGGVVVVEHGGGSCVAFCWLCMWIEEQGKLLLLLC